jgi:hypothetical protein
LTLAGVPLTTVSASAFLTVDAGVMTCVVQPNCCPTVRLQPSTSVARYWSRWITVSCIFVSAWSSSMTVRPASSLPTEAITPAKARCPWSLVSSVPVLPRRIQTPTHLPIQLRGSSEIIGGTVTPTGSPVVAVGSVALCVRAKRAPLAVWNGEQ